MFDMKYSEAAEFLGVEMGSLYKMVSSGKLHSQRVPGSRENLLDRSEVIRYRFRKEPDKAEQLINMVQANADTKEGQETSTPGATAPVLPTDGSQVFLQFIVLVGDIYTRKTQLEEETRAKTSNDIRAIILPIAEKIAAQSENIEHVLMQIAMRVAATDPDMSKGEITGPAIDRFANLFPSLPTNMKDDLINIMQATAKKERAYTIPELATA